MQNIKGIIVPIVTPLNDDESLNLGELCRQIDRQIDAGVNGIFCFGTHGEGFALSGEEKKQILSTAVKHVNGRVPVYAGTGCVSTKETIEQSLMAKEMGADVLSIVTPWFGKASQEELYYHYKAIAEAVDLPILLYNHPVATGNSLDPMTVRKLAIDFPNILGVKDSSGSWNTLRAYIDALHDRKNCVVLSGNDSLIVDGLLSGGRGAIAGCANVYPNTLVKIYKAFKAGDSLKAQEIQDSLTSFRHCFKFGNQNTVVKMALNMLGYRVGPCKAPFNQLDEDCMFLLDEVLQVNRDKGID